MKNSTPRFWSRLVPKSVTALREGYTPTIIGQDLMAGVTVGIVALPLALAFGIASGVTPERGLYTAIVGGFLISALGGSRFQIGGPTGAFVVIIYDVVARHGYEGLAVATLLAGGILVVMGLAGLGTIIKYIPYPVTTGFTAGIALVIFSSQVKDLFGLRMEAVPVHFIAKWIAYAGAFSSWNGWAVAIGAGSLLVLVVQPRLTRALPGPMVVVVLSALLVWGFALPVETIGSRFGTIPAGLPPPALPGLPEGGWGAVRALLPDALAIAVLGAIESLLCAVVADGMTGARHRSNMELVAQGLANVGSVFFGGLPATGALARTATSIKAGARTPLAGMIHAATLLGITLALAPLAVHIPLAALAAILVLVAWNMSEFGRFAGLLRAPKSDSTVMLTTFGLTVLLDLTIAVQAGVVLATLLFMKRMSDLGQAGPLPLREPADGSDTNGDPDAIARKDVPAGVEVYEINGPFFFGVADRLKDTLSGIQPAPQVLILRLRHVPAVDATGMRALEAVLQKCRRQGTALVLSGVNAQPARAFRGIGLDRLIGQENMLTHVDLALDRARAILQERGREETG